MNNPDGPAPHPKRDSDGVSTFYDPKRHETSRDAIDVTKPASEQPDNADEARADDRQMLVSLAKIDDVDAKLWRLQQRVAASEKYHQQFAGELESLRTALNRNSKGDNMVRIMLWGVVILVVVGVAALAVFAVPAWRQ